MQVSRHEPPYIWLPGIVHCISQFLNANEISCTLRLLNKATAHQFADRAVVRLSQPVPHYAFRYEWDNDQSMSVYTLEKRRAFVALTAASGCLSNLELAVQRAGVDLTNHTAEHNPLSAAAAAGQIHICEWLKQRGCPIDCKCQLAAASRAGRQGVCAWMLNNGWRWSDAGVIGAACGGHPTLMAWLLARKPHQAPLLDSQFVMDAAAEGCDLASLQWIYSECRPQENVAQGPIARRAVDFLLLLTSAAGSPTPDWQDKVKWVEAQQDSKTYKTAICLEAVQCSNVFERITWLQERGYPVDMEVVMAAAESGNLAVLRMLLDSGVERDDQYMACGAAESGQLVALKLLHERGCWLGEPGRLLRCATGAGQMEVVEWLVQELGVELHEGIDLVHLAAEAGSVALLEWLHERGCRASEEVFKYAAKGGCEDVIEWLLAHGYNFPSHRRATDDIYYTACREGDLATLECCLFRYACDWDYSLMKIYMDCFPPGILAWFKKKMRDGDLMYDPELESEEDDEESLRDSDEED